MNNFADLNKDAGVGAHPLVHPACSMALTSKKEKHFPISQASTLSIGNALHYSQYSQLLGDWSKHFARPVQFCARVCRVGQKGEWAWPKWR